MSQHDLLFEDIAKAAQHPVLLNAHQHFTRIKKPDYPSMTYFGVNFRGGKIVSIKFYFAFFNRLNRADVQLFLPTDKDFFKYYHLWQPTKFRSLDHTGCTFTIKFKESSEPTYGFHFRLKDGEESYRLIGKAETLPFDCLKLGTSPGINYEYKGTQKERRRYYYMTDAGHKDYMALRFNRKFAKQADLCEFTEFSGGSKINIWKLNHSKENRKRPRFFSENARAALTKIQRTYGLTSLSEGFYDDEKTIAAYFFALDQHDKSNFDSPENFHIDTIEKLIKNGASHV